MAKKTIKSNDFEQICYELEQGKNDNKEDKIKYVKKVLKSKIKRNYDKFLLIKAESRSSDITEFRSIMLSINAIVISVFAILISFLAMLPNSNIRNASGWIIFLLAILYAILCFKKITRFNFVGRWGQYVKIVLEEIENSKDYFK